ncbi:MULTISPECIES: hypothetical protein [unclassified Streptomyces]|uniref:hypothetical protein n=1 Tax=unclassified Streptomyces TaxID=2593676 RepID=UPI00139C80E5|nr:MULTISPECIES: hypothetical protein [unclassified Streptomyces]MYS20058.1 hypothetical protein [Streptomyces sp. SID4948]
MPPGTVEAVRCTGQRACALRDGRLGRVAAVSHGCRSALFRGVSILNTTQEAGR